MNPTDSKSFKLLSKISKHCKFLKEVKFGHNIKINDKLAIKFFKNLPNLISLEITCCKLTDRFIYNLIDKCIFLESLNLGYSPNITDSAIIAISLKLRLKKFYLYHNEFITDNSIISIAENCKSLTVFHGLNLNITDLSILSLIENCKDLQDVDLSASSLVTIESINKLEENISLLSNKSGLMIRSNFGLISYFNKK